MARLPTPGSDEHTWGDILNAFLSVEHTPNGALKTDGTLAQKADDSSVLHLRGDNSVTITDPTLVNGFTRIDLNYTPTNETPDSLVFYHNGVRTGYHNEKGELRARSAAINSVPFRVQQRSGSQTANLTEWTQTDNTILAHVDAVGNIFAPNLTPSSWQELAYEPNASAASGYATPSVRLEPLNQVVRMRGAIQVTAPGFTSGTVIATVPANYRPPQTFRCITRYAGSGSAGVLLTVNTNGTVTIAANITSSDNIIPIDNISWPL